MQNTTADYKIEINKPSRSFECKITIGNNIYTNEDLVNLTLEYTQPQEGFAIGNTISKSLDLTLLNRGDIIYSTSQIKIEIGLRIGPTIEYILMGIFNIDDIEKTDYTTKFTAYDNMIKFETAYFSSLGDKPTLKQVVNELSKITGVEFTGSLPAYTVSKLDGFTCREVLSYAASICGGNAFITRDGKFTIKSLSEVEKSIDGNNYFNYTREEVKYKVGKISCQVDENNILSKGSIGTDSMELGFENQWVTETIITEIYNKLNGLSYLGYSMKWQGDLSLDPYDIITVTDVKNVVRKIPILSQKITYTGGLTSEIGAKGETKNKNSFSSSGSTTNKVNRAVIEQAIIKEALIEKANIKDLEAVSIRTQTLEAKTAKIEELISDVAHIKDLNAINANIEKLIAADATINNALIGKADITELNAVKGTINVLESDTANIKNLLAGNITGESGQLIHLTASNVVIADAVIKDLIAKNISVQDLKASTISTNKFTIASDNGGLSIVGPTMQFKDKNNKVRIQIGQDTQGNFNFILRGADGTTTLIDHTGIKEKAIADDLIKSNMVAADAIGEKQINYSSLITGLNKDDNTSLIKASKVAIDLTGQSLEVSFNSLKSNVDNMEIGGRNLFKYSTLKSYQNQSFESDYKTGIIKGTQNWYFENYIDFEVGAQYTISIKNIINNSTIYPNEVACIFYDKVANKIIGEIGRLKSGKSITFEVPSTYNSNCVFLIYVSDNTKVSYELSKVKVEKGTKETDYTSAPEDIEEKIEANTTAISIAQGKIDGLISENSIIKGDVTTISDKYTSLKATVDGINTTVASHTSSIGTINTNISGLSGKVTTVENNYASLRQSLEGFKTTVANNYSTKTELSTVDGKVTGLTSRVSTAESSITQLNNKIALKVEATDVTEAINNVQIGGRNFVSQSDSFNKGSGYTGISSILNSDGTLSVTAASGNGNWFTGWAKGYGVTESNMNEGDIFTISFTMKSSNTISKPTIYIKSGMGYYSMQGTMSSNWSTIYYTGTWKKANEMSLYLGFSGVVGTIDIKNWKIEKGNKPTSWTPAPEDVKESISVVDTKITTTNNKVAEIETSLSSINLKVQSTEQTVATHTTQLGQVDTKISTAKSDAISTASSDATSKANSALTSAKNYTDGQITTVNQTITDKAAEIKLTTDSITQRVSSTESTLSSTVITANNALTNSNTANTKIDSLQVGGRNLLKNSKINITSKSYPICTLYITESISEGTECTISIKGQLGEGKDYFGIFNSGGSVRIVNVLPSDRDNDGVYRKTFSWVVGNATNSTLYIYPMPSAVSVDSSIEWIKLEVGNKATDWTPAPEDVDTAITTVDTKITTTNNKVASIETNLSSITQRVSSTESTVSTHTTQLGTVDSRINTAKNSAISTAANDATSKANNAQKNAINSAKTYTDGQITTVNKTITNKVAEIKATTDSITSKVEIIESTTTTINGNVTSLQSKVNTVESKITGTAIVNTISSTITGGKGSISTTQFVMDKNGLTIKNGALTIKNKSGTTVFSSDTNGNLIFTGTAKSQSGDQFVSMDSGGINFQDWHKKEQMLRIGTTYFPANRDMNGVNFAMPKYSDCIRFSHIAKEDLANGWSSSDAQYNFFDCWSSDQIVGSVTYKKGINIYAPMYINNRIKFNYNGSTLYTNDIVPVSWESINGILGIYGDNGAILGYQNGSDLHARIVVTEGAHPGTDDRIKSWGHWNCSGYVVHNATFRGAFQNSYANTLTRTFTETHCIEAENKQVRINFKDIQLKNGKAILNIPNKYMYINTGYIVSSIVKKGKGDVWIAEELENRFVIEGTEDIKINIEVIINIEADSLYSLKDTDEQPLCVDMSTGQPIGA